MPKKKLYVPGGIVYSTDLGFKTVDETGTGVTLPVSEQLLKVRLDAKHRGGKLVTLVEGLCGTPADLEQLDKQLKSYWATGGSVKKTGINIQGDNREKILKWLQKVAYKKARKK